MVGLAEVVGTVVEDVILEIGVDVILTEVEVLSGVLEEVEDKGDV